MKKNIFKVIFILSIVISGVIINVDIPSTTKVAKILTSDTDSKQKHHSHLREEPPKINHHGNMSSEEYVKAREKARAFKAKYDTGNKYNISNKRSKKINTSSSTSVWHSKGPFVGRVTAIVADPNNPNKVYVGTPAGGVWKSLDGGAHFVPIFENVGALSIGSLALDPHNSDIIYVGTGECDGGWSGLTEGDGIWKSSDGGRTWKHLGLEKSYNLGAILIDPEDSDNIFVAAYDKGETGIFKSIDGGKSWKNIRPSRQSFRRLHMDPNNSHRLYAEAWGNAEVNFATLWRSDDSGEHWKNISPITKTPRVMSIALAPSNPNRLYAWARFAETVHTNEGDYNTRIYRSDDYGDTWKVVNSIQYGEYSGPSRYCNSIKVSPTDKNIVYFLSVDVEKSTDGGKKLNILEYTHVDYHDLWISPDGKTMYDGNDGGVYVSKNAGNSYTYAPLPIGQLYSMYASKSSPKSIFAALQDNSCKATHNDGRTWQMYPAGDGMAVLSDNDGDVYCINQDGDVFFDTPSDNWSTIMTIPNMFWSRTMVFDASNTNIVYYGADNYLYTTTKIGDTISKATKASSQKFNQIHVINVPISGHGNTIYVVDDNYVWVSQDKGDTWKKSKLPYDYYYLNPSAIAVDPKNDAIAYVMENDAIYRTENYGSTWTKINLPTGGGVYADILIDPKYSSTLYYSNPFGVYISLDTGMSWRPLGQNLPEVETTDLQIVEDGDDAILYVSTYGRGIYSIRLNDTQRQNWAWLIPVLFPLMD